MASKACLLGGMDTETADDGTIYITLVTRFSTWEDREDADFPVTHEPLFSSKHSNTEADTKIKPDRIAYTDPNDARLIVS